MLNLKTFTATIIGLLMPLLLVAQTAENVFLITTDGLRWQEVFNGADSALLFSEKWTEDGKKVANKFWAATPKERREKLLPFFWKTVAQQGQIFGNKNIGSTVAIKNRYGFSYPGYNELLTGYPDSAVNSNDKKYNKHITVLEFLNQQPDLKNRVAAFATWDVFPYIINEPRSGVPVNAGVEASADTSLITNRLLNKIQAIYPSLASNRHDFITYFLAKEYVMAKQPKVLFLSFDETDEFAHEGKYREYLYAANTFDKMVEDLWNFCQSHPAYAGKTTFILTTDHGRGDKKKEEWTSHGQKIIDCGDIWLAALGKGISAKGERRQVATLYQNQVASTVAALLGKRYLANHPIGDKVTF